MLSPQTGDTSMATSTEGGFTNQLSPDTQQECLRYPRNRRNGEPPDCKMARGNTPTFYKPTLGKEGAEKETFYQISPANQGSSRKGRFTCLCSPKPDQATQVRLLPARQVADLTMLYLVDTGCNTNLINKRIFDCSLRHIQDKLMSCDTQQTNGVWH